MKVEKTPRKSKPKPPVPPNDEYEEITAIEAETAKASTEVETAAETTISKAEEASSSHLNEIDVNTVPRKKKVSLNQIKKRIIAYWKMLSFLYFI